MKKILFLACSAALPLFAVPFEPQMDLEDYALKGRFFRYNQSGDLGEPGKKAPGYSIAGFRTAKASPLRKDAVLPITFKEADGNYCIMIPGDPNLRECNFSIKPSVAGMCFPKAGEVVCSFRMKIAPDVSGKFNPPTPIYLDFRSYNKGVQYGSVKDRFHVLVSKGYVPTKEWKTYSFRTKVPAGNHPYSIVFRFYSNSADQTFNTLLFDDFEIRYADDESAPLEEAQIVHDEPNHIYYEGSPVAPKIRALLRSDADQEKLELVCRTRYDHQIIKRLPVTLEKAGRKTADGRNLYTGTVSFPMPRFGAYELLLLRGKDVMPCDIADFQMIRRPNTDLSPLQRKLGAHHAVAYSHFQGSWDNKTVPTRYRSSTEDVMSVLQNSGFGQVLLWFHFGALMRESPEKADTIHYRPTVEMMKKYNLTGIGNIGNGFLNSTGYRKNKQGKEYASIPMWLLNEKYKVRTSYIPHLRQWEILTAALLKDFGDQFHHWELMVEPQWCVTAEEYMPILKQTCRQVKAAGPEHKLLAVDATSDQGKNLTDWVQKLHNLGVEDYCDYVSFNPYGSGVDFMNGVRFRNTDLVNRIRKIVKPGTKLWQVELYYVPHSKRFQAKTNQGYFAGADGQRHILLGLKNQLFGVTCFASDSFFRGPYAASELVSAMSALSYFLRGKEKTEVPETKNQFVRQMIFRGKDDKNCSGAFWVLQTLPAKMILPQLPASVKFYDTYGNELKADKVMEVGLDPVFFTGTYKDLKTMLKTAAWDLGATVKLYRRACGDESFYEAENISGQKDSIAIFPEGREDGIRFNFNDTDLIRFRETGKAITQFNTAQNKKFEKVIDVPASPVYTLPAEGGLKLKTKNGVPFTLAAGENGSLIVTVEVPDTDVVCGKNFFDGDAVEVFIDRTPFRHIASEKIQNTLTDLRVKQFAFDPNGRIFSKNLVTMVQEPGKTSVKVEKTAGVYTVTGTSANGCVNFATVTISESPNYNIPLTQSICEGESYYFHGQNLTTAGTYTHTLQTVNGCDSVLTLTLTVNPLPTVAITGNTSICEGGSTTLTASGADTYNWSTGDNTASATVSAFGIYTVTGTSVEGCSNTSEVTVLVSQLPVITITGETDICAGESTTLTANGGETYLWSNGTTDATLTVSNAGTYQVIGYNEAGCNAMASTIVSIWQPATSEFSVECSDSCYTWNDQSYCTSGDYTQTLQTVHGCDSVVTLHLTITVGIEDHNLGASMTVYPNPTTGIVNVQCTMNNVQEETVDFLVYDAFGRLLRSTDGVETQNFASLQTDTHGSSVQTQIDLFRFAPGIYFVKAVANGKDVAVRKVVKR